MEKTSWLNLPSLSFSVKTLFTGYLMVTGVGLLMAGAQILLTHGMADGKFGLSVDDIVYSYYGNRTGSTLEAKLNGSMKDNAPPAARFALIKWARKGAPKSEWKPKIQPIVNQYCAKCHGVISGIPDLPKYDVIKVLAKVDHGATMSSLTRVSHIHLFGISFIFFFVGLIFSMSVGFKPWVKAALIFTPFAFLVVDVSSWWLTKWDPNFAWLVIVGGLGYSLASTVMIFTSLYQMWIMPWRGQRSNENTWHIDGQE
ncbi:MAG: elongation factor-1 alpha [Hydrogenovibrio sp.]|nr:elongation factor-1 alpha [Hydrogenovibrio sp.]